MRGVNAAGVIKTLLDKKLITTAGRKEVIGRPVLYKTTKDFLMQFGLKDLSELPSLEEFEELSKAAMLETELVTAETAGPEASAGESAGVEEVQASGDESSAAGVDGTEAVLHENSEAAAASNKQPDQADGRLADSQQEPTEPQR